MTGWTAVLAACAACYLLKLAGYLAPAHWLADPRVAKASSLVTAGLLAALVTVQTLAEGSSLQPDARLPAVLAAAVALALRVPFLGVVVIGAAVAAGLRALGWG